MHHAAPAIHASGSTRRARCVSLHLHRLYPNQNKNNSTYDQILRLLNQCNDYQLQVILATTTALLDSNPFISNVDTSNDTELI